MHFEPVTVSQLGQSDTCPDRYHVGFIGKGARIWVHAAHRPECFGVLFDEQNPRRLLRFCCKASASRFCAALNRKERARIARAQTRKEVA